MSIIRKLDDSAVKLASRLLREGRLVAFPTETVYGLGADAGNGEALARLFEAKGRPRFNPLIIHVADVEAARGIGVFNDMAEQLAEAFWPGALTLILPLRTEGGIHPLATAGLDTVALRVPGHEGARKLLDEVGEPIAAPSANPSGRLSPTTAAAVAEGLGDKVALILDGGPTRVGLESTIILPGDEGEPSRLLRPGGVTRERIEEITGPLEAPNGEAVIAPGMLKSHYAPRAGLRLNAQAAKEGESLLGFGPHAPKGALNLSPTGDLTEAAANLFGYLRRLDSEHSTCIAVMPIPETGLGEAINERLARAAAPRD